SSASRASAYLLLIILRLASLVRCQARPANEGHAGLARRGDESIPPYHFNEAGGVLLRHLAADAGGAAAIAAGEERLTFHGGSPFGGRIVRTRALCYRRATSEARFRLIIECTSCHARYQYDEERFERKPSKKIKCAKCSSIF